MSLRNRKQFITRKPVAENHQLPWLHHIIIYLFIFYSE